MKNHSLLQKFLFFSYMAVLLSLMLFTLRTDQIEVPSQLFGIKIDKVVHFALFLPYPFLIWYAFKVQFTDRFKRWAFPFIALSGLMLAILIEYAQSFNPNRTYDPYDMLANIAAIITGTILLIVIRYVWSCRLQ